MMETNKRGTAIIIFLLVTLELRGIVCAEAELRLIRDLMDGYDPDVRPCERIDEAVQVTIDITLHQIIEVDAKNQVITTSVWQRMYWKDEHLTWNASKYGGLERIRLSADRIWKPDITLINDVSGDFHNNQLDYPATILHDGHVRWLTPRLLTSSCTMDMTYFPWDNQTCTLQFTSWTHDNSEMTLVMKNSKADSTDFVKNGEWELVGLPVRTYTYSAPCCEVPFTNIEFDIEIHRRARYYITNLIFPSVLITAAGMLVFCLPPESGEKVSLSVTILLATTVYQLLLADGMPVQSISTPIIVRYIITTQVLLGLSMIFTVLVLDFHHQGLFGHVVPARLQKVVTVMATLLLLKGTSKKVWSSTGASENKGRSGSRKRAKNTGEGEGNNSVPMNSLPSSFGIKRGRASSRDTEFSPANEISDVQSSVQNSKLYDINEVLSGFHVTLRDKEADDKRMLEWRLVAKVFDRLFLIMFTICFLVSTFTLLCGYPKL